MKKFILAALACSAATVALPASANAAQVIYTFDGTTAGTANGSPFGGSTVFTGITTEEEIANGGSIIFSSLTALFNGNSLFTFADGSAASTATGFHLFTGNILIAGFQNTGGSNFTLTPGGTFTTSPNIGPIQILSGAGTLSTVVSAVPEPATWAMMIGGFGMVGGAMRSARRKTKVSVSYA